MHFQWNISELPAYLSEASSGFLRCIAEYFRPAAFRLLLQAACYLCIWKRKTPTNTGSTLPGVQPEMQARCLLLQAVSISQVRVGRAPQTDYSSWCRDSTCDWSAGSSIAICLSYRLRDFIARHRGILGRTCLCARWYLSISVFHFRQFARSLHCWSC